MSSAEQLTPDEYRRRARYYRARSAGARDEQIAAAYRALADRYEQLALTTEKSAPRG